MMREHQCVAIGWADSDDLTAITNDKAGKEKILQALLSHDPLINHGAAGKAAQQIFHFSWTIATGDLVLSPHLRGAEELHSRPYTLSICEPSPGQALP